MPKPSSRILWLVALVASAALPLIPVEFWLPKLTMNAEELSTLQPRLPRMTPPNLPSFFRATLNGLRRFPLVISPADESVTIDQAAEWIAGHRATVKLWLDQYGAVLLRGFAVQEAAQFERVASAYTDRLDNVYLGTSPREPVNGTQFVFTASEFEPWKVVPLHCEMSFLPRPPELVFFFAAAMPADMVGGETPLVDMRAVAREMGPSVRASFETNGLRYIRHYPSEKSSHPIDTWDVFKTKPYQKMFAHVCAPRLPRRPCVVPTGGTRANRGPCVSDPSSLACHLRQVPSASENRTAVEVESRRQGFEPSWGARGILKLTHEMDAFRMHPSTGELIWHNHLSVLHSASWADEFAYAAHHLKSVPYALISYLFYALDALMHFAVGAEALGQHVTHRNGAPITSEHVWHARRLMWRHMSISPWQQGDIIIIDNYRIAHARMPFVASGPRRLWAIWTKPPAAME